MGRDGDRAGVRCWMWKGWRNDQGALGSLEWSWQGAKLVLLLQPKQQGRKKLSSLLLPKESISAHSTSSDPIPLVFSPGQWAQKTNSICPLRVSCANTVLSASQDVQSLFKYAHKSMLICLCFLLRPAGSSLESGRQLTSLKLPWKSRPNVWILAPCSLGMWIIFLVCSRQPDLPTAFSFKNWGYFCLVLGLPFPPPPNTSWIHLSIIHFQPPPKQKGEFPELTKSGKSSKVGERVSNTGIYLQALLAFLALDFALSLLSISQHGTDFGAELHKTSLSLLSGPKELEDVQDVLLTPDGVFYGSFLEVD